MMWNVNRKLSQKRSFKFCIGVIGYADSEYEVIRNKLLTFVVNKLIPSVSPTRVQT